MKEKSNGCEWSNSDRSSWSGPGTAASSDQRAAGGELFDRDRRGLHRQAGPSSGAGRLAQHRGPRQGCRELQGILEETTKGREVYVEARLRIPEYEAKDNGGKRQRAEIIATRVQFLGAGPNDAKGANTVEEWVAPVDG